MSEPLLVASGLGKAYGAPVLEDVDLELRAGEVHAVVGENGAGKSTLAKILAGIVRPDHGSMTFRGRRHAPRSRREARDAGIAIVHQELSAIATLSVAEMLFLGALPSRAFVLDRTRLRGAAREALARVGLGDLDPDRRVGGLGLGYLQLVEIAAALAVRCDVLLLDEPTAALSPKEAETLFAQLEHLRAAGTAVVLVTHRLEEVQRAADRVTVLRDGRVVATRPAAALGRDEMVRMMVGRPPSDIPARALASFGDVALRVIGLSSPRVRDVSFEVRRGEILGLAGLMGAGRTGLLRALYGADRTTAGAVHVGGSAAPARIRSPRDARRHGIALLTEERKRDGLLLPCSVRANATLGALDLVAGRFGTLSPDRERSRIAPILEGLALRARSLDQPVAQLSGGNQQKVLLGRVLLRDPAVLLIDEPTRGVDVGARAEVHRLLLDLASRGKALVVASSEIEELLALADRILVLSRGRVRATFSRGEWSAESVMGAAVAAGDGGDAAARTA